MRFGRCKSCNEYKHIPEQSTCPTCLEEDSTEQDGQWEVVCSIPGNPPVEHRQNLTKSRAKSIASKRNWLYAMPMGE